jgi:alpha-galactosidase/6-phospho-beta-glucosidase family protein
VQVTIIGGGSYQWTPELLADLLGTRCLGGMRLVLEDVDPEPLPKMAALSARLDEVLGCGAQVVTTTDQKEALDGADFVIVTISTGGFESMAVDLDVPARYGVRQSVGDTVGPGGINRALRNIPVLVGVARDMEVLCPKAWLLNITNPMTCLTRAVVRETGVRAAGLCHEVGNWCLDLAIALGLPAEAVRPVVEGVNHLPVVTALDVDGRDGFEVLREMIEERGGRRALRVRPEEEPPPFSRADFVRRHLLALALFDRWGAVPAAGDRHLAEFLPSLLTEESGWGASFGIELTTIDQRQRHQRQYVADVEAWLDGGKELQTWPSGELPALVIDSLVTGARRELPVNIPNAGQCADLPEGAVVESICVVDGDGVAGRDRASAPPVFAELLRRHVAVQELTVAAAVSGDRRLATAAFELDPLSGRIDLLRVESMVDELLAGTAQWLPQFV